MSMRPDIWCPRHWAIVEAEAKTATILLMSHIVENRVFVGECGGDVASCPDSVIDLVVKKLSPLCCLLDEHEFRGLLQNDGRDIVAKLLRSVAKGAP
jgi:hypothetical protein